MEHVKRSELSDALWLFVSECVLDRDNLSRKPGAANLEAQRFISKFAAPHTRYLLLLVIDYLELKVATPTFRVPFQTGDRRNFASVRFQKLDQELLAEMAIGPIDSDDQWPTNMRVGECVAVVEVESGSVEKAVERAVSATDAALNLLRASVMSGGFLPIDFMLQPKRSGNYLAKEVGRSRLTTGWSMSTPQTYTYDERDADACLAIAKRIDALNGPSASPKIADAFFRAFEWVGQSTMRDNADSKVIDLCTALECVLTNEHDGRKGEIIVIRGLLLAGTPYKPPLMLRPGRLFELYLKRSRVVHGGARGISTRDDWHLLRRWALGILDAALSVVETTPGLGKLTDFFKFIETADQLADVVSFLETATPPGSKLESVLEEAKARAARTRAI